MMIHKFGGASVKDTASFRNLASIVQSFPKATPCLIVVSAMGKTTNALEEIFKLAYAGKSCQAQFDQLKQYHLQTATELFPEASHPVFAALQKQFTQLETKLTRFTTTDFDAEYDQV